MWILPSNLPLSSSVLATLEYISDSNEQSQACGSSLLVRSKLSPVRTWSAKWKRDSWTQHLSGRILNPSQASSFATAWTSLWAVIPASHSLQPASDSAQTTHATYGPSSVSRSDSSGPDTASSKTSMGTSRWDSPQSSAIWKKMVTEQRGEYSQRLKSARLTSENGCSSLPLGEMRWCTPVANDDNKSPEAHLAMKVRNGRTSGVITSLTVQMKAASWLTPRAVEVESDPKFVERMGDRSEGCYASLSHQMKAIDWPTPRASAITCGDSNFEQRKADGKVSTPKLGTAVLNWPTCSTRDWKDTPGMATTATNPDGSNRSRLDQLPRAVAAWPTPDVSDRRGPNSKQQGLSNCVYGQADQAKDSIAGSLPEQWRTPSDPSKRGGAQDAETRKAQGHTVNLEDQVYKQGKLNPRWVETLMGLPVGWTMPSCTSPVTIAPTSCDCSGTVSSQPQLRGLGESFLRD